MENRVNSASCFQSARGGDIQATHPLSFVSYLYMSAFCPPHPQCGSPLWMVPFPAPCRDSTWLAHWHALAPTCNAMFLVATHMHLLLLLPVLSTCIHCTKDSGGSELRLRLEDGSDGWDGLSFLPGSEILTRPTHLSNDSRNFPYYICILANPGQLPM